MQLTEQMRQWREQGVSYREIARRMHKHSKTVMIAFGATADRHGKRVLHLPGGNEVETTPPDNQAPTASPDPNLRGFTVDAKTRVAARRPAVTIRARLYTLRRGQAFRELDLAKAWGVSTDTVRKHAQDADCFRYVDLGNESWEPCIMHPDTAKAYPTN